jgi:hypothetical protein
MLTASLNPSKLACYLNNPVPSQCQVTAIYSFQGQLPCDLSFKAGKFLYQYHKSIFKLEMKS